MECEVCLEHFNVDERRPKVMACGHTLCLRCVTVHKQCHKDRRVVEDVDALADNFYIISIIENDRYRKHRRKFFCLTCQMAALQVCEEEHDICNLKKKRQEEVLPVQQAVQDGVDLQQTILARITGLFPLVAENFNRMVDGANECQDAMIHVLERTQGILETNGDDAAWLDASEVLNDAARQFEEKRTSLERLLGLLERGGRCQLRIDLKPVEEEGKAAMHGVAQVDLDADSDQSRAIRAILYMLCSSGYLQETRLRAQEQPQDSGSDWDDMEDAEDSVQGAACPDLLAERAEARSRRSRSSNNNMGSSSSNNNMSSFAGSSSSNNNNMGSFAGSSNNMSSFAGSSNMISFAGSSIFASGGWPIGRAPKKPPNRENYELLKSLEGQDAVRHTKPFDCPVCLDHYDEGVILKGCLHVFCRDCLSNTVQHSEEAAVKCPYQDDDYSCENVLTEREIRTLVSPDVFEQHLQRSVKQAEATLDNTFHCKTVDCRGWCQFEVGVNQYFCDVCEHRNCLQCQVIHENEDCKQYQDRIKREAQTNAEARATHDALEGMVASGNAMRCPKCDVIIMKRGGCDALICAMCKLNICWATKQARWGPNGPGDTSGGCRCKVNGRSCHPNCQNCH